MIYTQAEKPVTTNHPKLGKIEFTVEVPQAQSVEEVTQMCGSAENHLAFDNGQIATNAKNAARAYARNFDVAEDADESTFPELVKQIEAKGAQLARDYTPSADSDRGPSAKKRAQKFDAIAELVQSGEEFTKEQLMAIIAQAK